MKEMGLHFSRVHDSLEIIKYNPAIAALLQRLRRALIKYTFTAARAFPYVQRNTRHFITSIVSPTTPRRTNTSEETIALAMHDELVKKIDTRL